MVKTLISELIKVMDCLDNEFQHKDELIPAWIVEAYETIESALAGAKPDALAEYICDINSLNKYIKAIGLGIYVDDTIHDCTGTYYFRLIGDVKLNQWKATGKLPQMIRRDFAEKTSIGFAEICNFNDWAIGEWIYECQDASLE